ncbi:proteasome component M29 [Ascosphaera acerosa]|nr:proteasome component M29 [Ascosphaera acerosa]
MAEETPAAREMRLVEAVEMRIALADSDAKLEELLNKYLAPLLLKLLSPSCEVHRKVVAICSHINTRIKPIENLKLPVPALLRQFRENTWPILRNFDLLYIKEGLQRMSPEEQAAVLPDLIDDISNIKSHWHVSTIFYLFLKALPSLQLPERGTPRDASLREHLRITDADAAFLAKHCTNVLLLRPPSDADETAASPGVYRGMTPDDYKLICHWKPFDEAWNPATPNGLNLAQTKLTVAKFLASGAFADSERLAAFVVMLADSNSHVVKVGEMMQKHCTFDLEDGHNVSVLYQLVLGECQRNGLLSPAPPNVQIKALELLSKSRLAARDADQILVMIERSLSPDSANYAGGLEKQKFRQSLFAFIAWVARMGDAATLNQIAPAATQSIQDFVHKQGWPNVGRHRGQLSAMDLNARTMVYETLGILAAKLDRTTITTDMVKSDVDLLSWLLASYCTDDSGAHMAVSIDQALGSLLNALAKAISPARPRDPTPQVRNLQGNISMLLTTYMALEEGDKEPKTGAAVVRHARFIVLRYANRCLPFSDIGARWLNLQALGRGHRGERPEILEEAQKGLDPRWFAMEHSWIAGPGSMQALLQLPSLNDLALVMFNYDAEELGLALPSKFQGTAAVPRGSAHLSSGTAEPPSLVPALRFARNVLLHEALRVSEAGPPPLAEADWDQYLETKLKTDEACREAVRVYVNDADHISGVRGYLRAALAGLVFSDSTFLKSPETAKCGSLFIEIASLAHNECLAPVVDGAAHCSLDIALNTNDLALQDMGSRAVSIIISHPAYTATTRDELLSHATAQLADWKNAAGAQLIQVRAALLMIVKTTARMCLRSSKDPSHDKTVAGVARLVIHMACEAHDSCVRDAAHVSLMQLCLSGALTSIALPGEDSEIDTRLLTALTERARAENETAILALGYLSLSINQSSAAWSAIRERLYGLHDIKKAECQFTVGEAFSLLAFGHDSRVLLTEYDVEMQHLGSITTGVTEESVVAVLDGVIEGCQSPKPTLQKAAAIWLLSLMRFGKHNNALKTRLRVCQEAFLRLLSSRDHLVQETASRGLSLVYDMGSQSVRDALIRDLIQSFTVDTTSSKTVFGGGQVSQDTELFTTGTMPTSGGASMSTYRDVVNLASEAGDPSLVYRFMSLAASDAIWSSRAAFGQFGLGSLFSKSAVSGHLAQNPVIYAKLYRYRFDPNPTVQRSMQNIWDAVVKDTNAAINEHFDLIICDLLSSITDGKEWRVREASCAAIADLIQGRQLDKYEPHLDEILTKAFKVLDDIKGSVRAAALRLCQVVTNVVIHMLEASDASTVKRPRVMLDHLIPFLLGEQGMLSSVQDIQSYATVTLCTIIKKCPATVLRKYTPVLMERFLGSLSSFEPQAVNYVHLNADKYGMTGHDIDKMRLSAIRESPMMEAIELHLVDAIDPSDAESVSATATAIERVLRTAIGLPSKVGVSRVIALLCAKPQVFSAHADAFMKLVRKQVLDRNATVSASYSHCLGYLTRLASSTEILATIQFAHSLYFHSEPADDSARRRVVASEVISAMVKQANDQMMTHASAFLPIVFIAQHDEDNSVRDQFHEVWTECVSGTRAISSLYFSEILQIISEQLNSAQWVVKHASALAVATMTDALIAETSDEVIDTSRATRLWPILERAVSGKSWEGKEKVLDAFVKYACGTADFQSSKPDVRKAMLTIALREAKRNSPTYRPHALRALGTFAHGQPDVQLLRDATAIVQGVIVATDAEDDAGSGSKQQPSESGIASDTLSAAVTCIFGCMNPSHAEEADLRRAADVIKTMVRKGSKDTVLSLYEGLGQLYRDTAAKMGEGCDPTSLDRLRQVMAVVTRDLLLWKCDHPGLALEAVRLERAHAAVACAACRVPSTDNDVRDAVLAWLTQERSAQVQNELRKCLP